MTNTKIVKVELGKEKNSLFQEYLEADGPPYVSSMEQEPVEGTKNNIFTQFLHRYKLNKPHNPTTSILATPLREINQRVL